MQTAHAEYKKYLKHPLFLKIRSVVMRSANYTCKCGERATEVHHLDYPPWGAFDTPDNMIAVCHKCHCEIETKKKGRPCK